MEKTDKLYSVWNQMKQRCNNPNATRYSNYGARGIRVEWTSWREFRDWALSTGYREGLSIDRINNDGNYTETNCQWTTPGMQARNKVNTIKLTAFGETKTALEWVEDPRCAVNYTTLVQRIRKGKNWTTEEMVTLPSCSQRNGSPLQIISPAVRERARDREKRISPVPPPTCPQGHDNSINRVKNRRGDHYCRSCKRERNRLAYLANPEPARAASRARYLKEKAQHGRDDKAQP